MTKFEMSLVIFSIIGASGSVELNIGAVRFLQSK